MARITHVKKARQRYATIPVIDPETGEQKKTPVMRKQTVRNDDGTTTVTQVQKTTKAGRPVFMSITVSDKSQPLPDRTCEACKTEIKVGDPYKHVTPKSGPYGGRIRVRCAGCPSWQEWDLSNSLSARIAQIVDAAQVDEDTTDEGAYTSALEDAAAEIREIANEKRESSENMEEGFGHETSMSAELAEVADELEGWADEIEAAQIPERPEGEAECGECEGTGTIDDEGNDITCPECDGEGTVACEDLSDDQESEWYSEVEDAMGILEECPV